MSEMDMRRIVDRAVKLILDDVAFTPPEGHGYDGVLAMKVERTVERVMVWAAENASKVLL